MTRPLLSMFDVRFEPSDGAPGWKGGMTVTVLAVDASEALQGAIEAMSVVPGFVAGHRPMDVKCLGTETAVSRRWVTLPPAEPGAPTKCPKCDHPPDNHGAFTCWLNCGCGMTYWQGAWHVGAELNANATGPVEPGATKDGETT